jgi:ABC-type nitrate/sulfonate/bicarbonate transport system ATPase subunit
MLSVKNLVFAYEKTAIFKNLSFSLNKGEIASFIGTSGSGKTTLFKLLTGINQAQSGNITIEGNAQPAYMTQNDLLLPWRTVLENITLTHELGKNNLDPELAHDEAMQLIREVDLVGYENKYPKELSGGMRQRVSLARALMQKSPLLLLDEPFASLDIQLREQMHDLLRNIHTHHNTTILLITHDIRDAISLSDHIFHLSDGTIQNQWKIEKSSRKDPSTMGTLYEELRHTMLST